MKIHKMYEFRSEVVCLNLEINLKAVDYIVFFKTYKAF